MTRSVHAMMAVFANNTKLVFIMMMCLFGNEQFGLGKLSLDEVSINVNVDNDGDNVIIANDISVSGNNPSSSDSIDYESLVRQLEGKAIFVVLFSYLSGVCSMFACTLFSTLRLFHESNNPKRTLREPQKFKTRE